MNTNKVVFGSKVLIDLTSDTVTPDKLAFGYSAHDKAGSVIVGTLQESRGPEITISIGTGATVTATKETLSVTGVSENGICVLSLPDFGTWTIAAHLSNGYVSYSTINIQNAYSKSMTCFDPVFSNNSWEEIALACQLDCVPSTWVVGDQKDITISGTNYSIDIIGKRHDHYADGGVAPVTFQMRNCYPTRYTMHSGTAFVNWDNTYMKTQRMIIVQDNIPSEIEPFLREVTKKYVLNTAGEVATCVDKLFLLSEKEIFGSATYASEGEQYEYYANGGSKIKQTNGSNNIWWTRSHASNTNYYLYVTSDGKSASMAQASSGGLACAFCF